MKLPLKDIKPNPDNPRFIKDDKFEKLVKSLKEFPEMSEVREIVINKDNVILGGNMRFKAMQAAGWTEAPVRVVNWPEDKQKEFIIKDNVSGGEWDWDAVANQYELEDLDAWGVDLPESLLPEEEIVEDEAPPVADVAVSKLGEIYQLGRHRLMCGNANALDELVEQDVDMIFTDPPYNVDYTGKTKDALKIENDSFKDNEAYYDFLLDIFGHMATKIKGGAAVYVAHPDNRGEWVRRAFREAGLYLSQCIIWNKNNMVMGRQDYHWKHEPIIYGWREGASHKFYGPRNLTTVWDIDRPSRSEEHPTMKPIALIAKALHNSTKDGDYVLDPFGGSGSTLIACEQLNRTCYMMELDPKYCDVIRKRYWKYTHDNNEEGWENGTPAIS